MSSGLSESELMDLDERGWDVIEKVRLKGLLKAERDLARAVELLGRAQAALDGSDESDQLWVDINKFGVEGEK